MKKPIVVNLTGAPGAGKSTGAAWIFSQLKQLGINCELINEFAKDKTWETNTKALSCQEYIFGKQSYKMARCRNEVDVIITDSPLPLAIFYNQNDAIKNSFIPFVMDIYNTYENMNFFINRVKPYNPKGRNQTESESDVLSVEIKQLYDNLGLTYLEVDGNQQGYSEITHLVLQKIETLD